MVVVGLAPLSFAGMVWPAARPAARKVGELTAAALLAKPAIFLALKVGLALVGQHTATSGAGWGSLLVGVTVVTIAAFAPWVVWRLLPLAEAYMVAQGVSRMPFRGAMQVLQTAYWADMIRSRTGPGRTAGAGLPPAGRGGPGGPGPGRSPLPRGGGGGGQRPAAPAPGAGAGSGSSGGAAGGSGGAAGAVGRVAAGVAAGAASTSAATGGGSGRAAGGRGAAAAGRPSDGWTRRPPAGRRPRSWP
jgi:hypothetical protein